MFTVRDSTIIAIDPMHDSGIWCSAKLVNCKPGKWESFVVKTEDDQWGSKIKSLTVIHFDYKNQTNLQYFKLDRMVGVTSGLAGFFEKKSFDDVFRAGREEFFHKNIDKTVQNNIKYFSYGVAVSSGYGNGDYDIEMSVNPANQIIALRIAFLPSFD